MPLKDLLRRKDKGNSDESPSKAEQSSQPEFTFMRTTTTNQEILETIKPRSSLPEEGNAASPISNQRASRFRSSSNASTSSRDTKPEKRLSSLLHLRNHSKGSSINVPADLPNIDDRNEGQEEKEAKWEERATILAQENPNLRQGAFDSSMPPAGQEITPGAVNGLEAKSTPRRSISNREGDDHIQEAIRLHEAGDLPRSTEMFGRLADPNGENNALSQVLYGLALRHGWGITPNPSLAITYLSQAASNSAAIESLALSSGMKAGGAAKGELVLAIYELANCFRHGWGVAKDPVAARSYYETAANLGDTDAMNEAAWCYENGVGGKKDKFTAATWYRRAEEKGNKTLGNSWIWKDKYNPKEPGKDSN